MNAELLFGALYIAGFIGGAILFLCIGEGLFNFLYRFPRFRNWLENSFGGLPNWDSERD